MSLRKPKPKLIPEEIVILSSDEDEDYRNPLGDIDEKVIALDSDDPEVIASSPPRVVSPSLLAKLKPLDTLEPKTENVTVEKAEQDEAEAILPDISIDDDAEVVPPVVCQEPEPVNNVQSIQNDTTAEIVNEEPVLSSSIVSTTTNETVTDMEVEDHGEVEADSSVNCGTTDESKPQKMDVDDSTVSAKPDEVASSSSNMNGVLKPAVAMEKLIQALKKLVNKTEYTQVKEKLWKKYGLLEFSTPEFETAVHRAIDGCANELLLRSGNKWKELKKLFDFLKMCHENPAAALGNGKVDAGDDAKRAARKEKQIKKLERKLEKYEKLIEKWDQKEVDWEREDEQNSEYLVKTRLVNQYMKLYAALCEVTGCNKFTGRPTQKKVNIKGFTRFSELETEVEKLLNSKGSLFTPDYHDMIKITKSVNTEKKLMLSSEEINSTALDLLHKVVRMLKKRRFKDHKIALKIDDCEVEDPAENDPELERKLEENKLKARQIKNVIDEFAEKQEKMKLTPKEIVEEDADGSAEESDDEDEESDAEAEESEDGSGSIESIAKDADDPQAEEPGSDSSTRNGYQSSRTRNSIPEEKSDTIDLVDSETDSPSDDDEDPDPLKVPEQNGGGPKSKKPRLDNDK